MARLDLNGSGDLIRQLEQLGSEIENVEKKMINSALPILESKVKSNYTAIPKTNRSTGELEKSIYIKKAEEYGEGKIVGYVTFKGKQRIYKSSGNRVKARKTAVRNGEIAAYMEYGTSGEPAHPFLRPAMAQTKDKCLEKMQETFDAEVRRI